MKTRTLILLTVLFSLPAFGQQDSIAGKLLSFVKNIETFNYLYLQEKAYLHFDNTGYFLGETMWFKAYVVTASDLEPSPSSKVLYVDLLSPEGRVLESKKLKLENGQAHGDFMLKDSLFAGYYEVRAYTKCMLNYGEDVVFSRVFPVFNKPKQDGDYKNPQMKDRPKNKQAAMIRNVPDYKTVNMTFFPESGNLLEGLNNRVAFKITGNEGQAIDAEGVVRNEAGEDVVTFSTVHEGMGSFLLQPTREKYKAIVRFEGKDYKFDLPKSISSGYLLQCNNLNAENLTVQIDKTKDTPSKALGLSLTCRGKVCAFKIVEINEEEPYFLSIPKENLPTGVVRITLFDSEGQIYGERMAFVNHEWKTTSITSDITSSFQPLSPIQIDFQAKNSFGDPVATTFSLSVRDADCDIPTNYTDNLQSNLLLTSDLKGYISNPAYYFEKDDPAHRFALDLLLLTSGWSRYEWKQMAGVEPFEVKHGSEKGLMVEGKVLKAVGSKENPGVDVTFYMLTPYQKGTCTTDSLGKFNFLLDDFKGRQDMTFETRRNGKLTFSQLLLDRQFKPEVKSYTFNETHLSQFPQIIETAEDSVESKIEDTIAEIKDDSLILKYADNKKIKSHLLKEVVIKKKKKKSVEQVLTENAIEVIDMNQVLDDVKDVGGFESDNLIEFLEQNYPKKFDGLFYYLFKEGRKRPVTMIFRWKGMTLSNIFSYFGTDNIEKMIISQGYTETNPASGLIKDIVYVDIYGKPRMSNKKGTRKTYIQGYANVREFPSPDYSQVALPDEKDFRRTLYWNPDVQTDKNGKAEVHFFNSRTAKKLEVNTECVE